MEKHDGFRGVYKKGVGLMTVSFYLLLQAFGFMFTNSNLVKDSFYCYVPSVLGSKPANLHLTYHGNYYYMSLGGTSVNIHALGWIWINMKYPTPGIYIYFFFTLRSS